MKEIEILKIDKNSLKRVIKMIQSIIQKIVNDLPSLSSTVISGVAWDAIKKFLVSPISNAIQKFFDNRRDLEAFVEIVFEGNNNQLPTVDQVYTEVTGQKCPNDLIIEIRKEIIGYEEKIVSTVAYIEGDHSVFNNKINGNNNVVGIGNQVTNITNLNNTNLSVESHEKKIQSLLRAAWSDYNNGFEDNAKRKYKEIIDLDFENHIAWWGLFLCEVYFADYYRELHNDHYSWVRSQRNNINKYGNKAVEFAPSEEKDYYYKKIQALEETLYF